MNTQKAVDGYGNVYAELPILAGPHTWVIGEFQFTTVLCRTPDNAKGELSMVHTASGKRVAKVACKAPKRDGLTACSEVITRLRAEKGDETVVWVIFSATRLE